jgi:LPS export ABC transporter protein LptC
MGAIVSMGWRGTRAVGAAVAVVCWVWLQLPLPAAVAVQTTPAPFVDIQGTRLTGVDDAGRRLWEMQAASLQIDRDRNTIVLSDVTGWLYRGGTRYLQLHAPRAAYLTLTKTVQLSGGVAGSAPDGRAFTADRVQWTGTQLKAAGGIVLTQAGMTVRADQMSGDAALDAVTFEGHVAITFVPQ